MQKINSHRMSLFVFFSLLFVFLFSVFSAVPTRAADSKWTARYFANKTLSGNPVWETHEDKIDHNWGNDAPGANVPADNFSVRWTRRVHFTAGTYRFAATMDDGMRVWINDNEIISSWNDSQAHTVVVDMFIPEGEHNVKVEYYEATGGAVAQFSWGPAGGASTQNWQGQYFNNKDLFGQPTLVRSDPAINFNWGTGKPADSINGDDFSVRWTRTLNLEPGVYRFTTTTDDGVRLWVNNQLVIDQWKLQVLTSHSATVTVSGSVPVRMEYFEDKAQAVAQLNYVKVSGAAGSGDGAAPAAPDLPGWQGTYYNNTNLDDASVMVRQDQEIDFIWGSSSPQPNVVNADRFSVRWENSHNFPAGRYRFTTYVDGGVRLWVNNQLIIDEWKDPYKTVSYANIINLPGGPVPLRMEFFDDVGLAEARLVVSAESGSGTAVSPTSPSTPSSDLAPMTARVVNAYALNVRSGPSMEDEAFTHVGGGQVVSLTGCRSGGWVEIYLPDGSTGWVGGSYLAGNFVFSNLQVCASDS